MLHKHEKGRMTKTRISSAGLGKTPIAGAPQRVNDKMEKGTRVVSAPSLPRKNDPPKTAQSSMGLKIGSRVTSKETRTR